MLSWFSRHFRDATAEYFIVDCVGGEEAEKNAHYQSHLYFFKTKTCRTAWRPKMKPWRLCRAGQENGSFQKWQRFLRRGYVSCLEVCKHLYDVTSPGHRDKRLQQNSWDETGCWCKKSGGPCETDLNLRELHLVLLLLNINANVEDVWISVSFNQTYLFFICE